MATTKAKATVAPLKAAANVIAAVSPVAKQAAPAALKLLVNVKDIETAILAIHKTGQTLQQSIHVTACSVLKHLGEHGDVRLAAKLIAAMPEMGRANALCDWFAAFGPVIFDEKRQPNFVQGKATKLGDAMGNPFWKFKPELPYQPVDVVSAIEKLIQRLTKDQKETGVNHAPVINGLEKLKPAAPAAH